MTKLEAINEMLEWIGQPPVTALDTGGTTDEAEAENTLDRISQKVQQRGWYWNTELDVDYFVADVKIAVSGGAGTFTLGETVTQTTSGATGTFQYLTGGFIYLTRLTGTFANTLNLTGGTSGATRVGAAYTAITESLVPYGTDILRLWPNSAESAKVTQRNGYLWDTEDNTDVLEEDVRLDIVRLLDFTELPYTLANYITVQSAWSFLRYKMPGRTEGLQLRMLEIEKARIAVVQENSDLLKVNIHNTRDGQSFLGDRTNVLNGISV